MLRWAYDLQLPTSNSVDKLLDDLAEVIQQVKTMAKGEEGNMVALYGE